MFSRVNKGGTVFKPIARPKSRPPTDQASSSKQSSGIPDSGRSVSEGPRSVSAAFSGSVAATSQIKETAGNAEPSDDSQPASSIATTEHEHNSASVFVVHAVTRTTRPAVQGDPSVSTSSSHALVAESSVSQQGPIPIRLTAGQSHVVPIIVTNVRPSRPINTSTNPASSNVFANPVEYQGVTFGNSSTVPVNINASTPASGLSYQFRPEDPSGADMNEPGDVPPKTNEGAKKKKSRDRKKTSEKGVSGDFQTVTLEGVSADVTQDSAPTKSMRRKRVEKTPAALEADEDTQLPVPPVKRRRRRKSSLQGTDSEHDEPYASTKRRRRRHAPPLLVFDPEAGPGEEIDPTIMTMATLCEDTGQGRVSSKAVEIQRNFASWKAANREKRARMKAIQEVKKYGRRTEAEDQAGDMTATADPEASQALDTSTITVTNGSSDVPTPQVPRAEIDPATSEHEVMPDGFDYSQNMSTSRYTVQVRIGPSGETIVDEESLFVDRNEEDDTANYTHVEESDTTKFVNSATYSTKARGSRWSAEETELFYDALSQFGENYEMISMILPGRDRKACKAKFKAEDKRNSTRINHYLTHRVPYDMQTLSRLTGKDFSGPTPEIRAPTPLTLAEPNVGAASGSDAAPVSAKKGRKKSKTPGITNKGEEILGAVEEFEDQDVDSSPPATHTD